MNSSGGRGPKDCSILPCPCFLRYKDHAKLDVTQTCVYCSPYTRQPLLQDGFSLYGLPASPLAPCPLPVFGVFLIRIGRGTRWVVLVVECLGRPKGFLLGAGTIQQFLIVNFSLPQLGLGRYSLMNRLPGCSRGQTKCPDVGMSQSHLLERVKPSPLCPSLSFSLQAAATAFN